MDSAFYGAPAVSAARQAGARFSIAVRMDPKVRAAIAAIAEDAWTSIATPGPSGMTNSGAGSPTPGRRGRIRRVHPQRADDHCLADSPPRQGPESPGQGELFNAWRYHAIFTGTPYQTT
jgi:hypothetical protein